MEDMELSDFNMRKEIRDVIEKIHRLNIKTKSVYTITDEITDRIKKGKILPKENIQSFVNIINSRIEIQRNFTPLSALLAIVGMGVAVFITTVRGIPILNINDLILALLFVCLVICFPVFCLLVNSYYRYTQKMIFTKELFERSIKELKEETSENIK